jgi:hypothetical protein
MSLFDVIKYPLSIPVSGEEFIALPEAVREKYMTTRWHDSEWNAQQTPNATRRILRKLLEEYDDDL